jgi:hypothetical protein
MATTTQPLRIAPGSKGMQPARARWATVEIETDTGARYSGRVFVPETRKRVTDVLVDDRPFLFVTNVTASCSHTVEPFIAINKRFVRTVRIVDESEQDPVMRPWNQG